MPWKIKEHKTTPEGESGRYCVHEENADGSLGKIVACHESAEKARAHQKALYTNADDEMGESLVSTVDLTEDYETRPVEFLRIGVFVDAKGREVAIDDAKLNALVASFEGGQAGQDVPIDILHRREEAAGWVRGVYRQGDKLMADVEWNTLGRQLVGDKIYRYLSATIDLARNVLRSISLVNFPAVKGLRPVELAEDGVDAAPPSQLIASQEGQDTAPQAPSLPQETMTMADEQVQGTVPQTAPQAPPPAPVVLAEADLAEIRAKMEQEVRQAVLAEYAQLKASQEKMLAELMASMREERETVEFAQAVTTGAGRALPFTPDEMKDLIFALPQQYRAPIKDAFKRIVDTGLVDFSERGTSRGGVPRKLDADTGIALQRFLAGGNSVDAFFAALPELGNKSDYDLKEYGNG